LIDWSSLYRDMNRLIDPSLLTIFSAGERY